jgi:hexosaminidase
MKNIPGQTRTCASAVVLWATMVLIFNASGSPVMAQQTLPLIPAPKSWQPAPGFFPKRHLNSDTLVQHLDPQGELVSAEEEILAPGAVNEGYRLDIGPDGLVLRAQSHTGLFRGHQTVRQLMKAAGDSIPCGVIEDEPDFRWRGMLLDCGRHFMPLDTIKETIDQLAYHKFNVLHWHLTEDQGWRLEVPEYPLLTEVAAWRQESDGTTYGGYYSTEDVREVVAYAAERFITVVPEIELPGHSLAALAAYPELSCNGEPLEVETQWGIFKDVYCAGNEQTFEFLENVLTTALELFPSRYIHIGGDESPKDRWRACPKCQQRIVEENLADENELQSWFIRRIETFLGENDRRLIGWDEILEGGLAPDATVQSWRGTRGAIAAARQGHDAIVSPTSHCYFDYDVATLDLRKVHTFNPRPEELSDTENQHILGGEMNLWSEYIPPERLQNMLFPRLIAMAECLWTNPERRDFPEFLDRLRPHLEVLKAEGVKPGPADRPLYFEAELAADADFTLVKLTLDSELVEAVKSRSLQIHHRAVDRQEIPGYRPDLRVEDLPLPEVTLADPQVPENRQIPWENSGLAADLLIVQLFLDGFPYGTPAIVERSDHLGLGRQPSLLHQPSSRYPGGGTLGLGNGLHGSRNFRDGLWSGFEGTDLDATVILDHETEINRLAIRFYQGATAWVFLPKEVEFQVSEDGLAWQSVAVVKHRVSPYTQDRTVHEFVAEGLSLKALQVRVIGRNLGICPDWHPGAGQPCWIFADEIVVQ